MGLKSKERENRGGEGRQRGGSGWEDRELKRFSPQWSKVKAKNVLQRKSLQDGSSLF